MYMGKMRLSLPFSNGSISSVTAKIKEDTEGVNQVNNSKPMRKIIYFIN